MGQDRGQANWQAIWQTRGWRACALLPASALYFALTTLRRRLYQLGIFKSRRMQVPVVVIGNVVVGGAGKTPTVLALIEHLQKQGWHPGVISRGYGRAGTAPLEVLETTSAQKSGDEPALIKRQTGIPVYVAQQRAEAAQALLMAHPRVDILLCDDGLQHLALARDLSIVVFDERGTGNRWLLPAGLLREPWPPSPTSFARPNLVLQQRASSAPHTNPLPLASGGLPTYQARRRLSADAINAQGKRTNLQSLAAHPTLSAAAGIARPEAFFEMLRNEGLVLAHTTALPDHAAQGEYARLLSEQEGPLLCTEKDAVKLFETVRSEPTSANQTQQVWAVPLVLHIDPDFFKAVDGILAQQGHKPMPNAL